MGLTKVMLILLVLFDFSFPALFASLYNNLYSGKPLKQTRAKQIKEFNDFVVVGDNRVLKQIKIGHTGGRGGGQGNSSQQEASGAGAASHHNNHHGAAVSNYLGQNDKLLIIIVTTLTTLLLLISV